MGKFLNPLCTGGALFFSVGPIWGAELPTPRLSLSPIQTLDEAGPVGGVAPAVPEDPGYGITGNWFGVRDKLRANHLFAGGYVRLDGAKVLRGGLDTEAWPLSYQLDVNLTADLEGMAGWKGAMLFFEMLSHDQFTNGDAIVGDVQSYDNLTAPRFVQLSQFWYKQNFAGYGTLKIGKIDANGDASVPGGDAYTGFSLMAHSTEFLHSGSVYSPSMFALPTYPTGAPGIEVFLGSPAYIGVGAFYNNNHQTFLNISGHPETVQASSGGMFFIAEGGTRWTAGNLSGHAGIGGWYHNGDFPRNNAPDNNRGVGGGYLFVDQTLFIEESDGSATREVGAFFMAGASDKNTSPVDRSAVVGLTAIGFVPGRESDMAGVLCSWAHLPTQPGLLHPFELSAELFYKIQITSWASLKPDFQYIVHPSGTEPDAVVVTVRAEISF